MSWPIVWFMKMTTGPLHEGHNLKKGGSNQKNNPPVGLSQGASYYKHDSLLLERKQKGKY